MVEGTISVGSAARTLGIGVLAGAVSGFVVGGVGGRLFMFVLAQLNPEESGVLTPSIWASLPGGVSRTARVALTVLAVVTFTDLMSTIDEILNPFTFE